MSQVHQKCAEAAATLRELLLTAAQRGISVEDSFGHFDPQNEGVVDLAQFILGLRALGIPLSVESASMLLRQLSETSTTHLTVKDFHRLCIQLPVTKKKKLSAPVTTSRKRPKQKEVQHVAQPSKEELIAQAQGLPQWARDRSKRAFKELKNLSKKHRPYVIQSSQNEFDLSDDSAEEERAAPCAPMPILPTTQVARQVFEVDESKYEAYSIDDQIELRYAILHAPMEAVEAQMAWKGEELASEQSKVTRQLKTAKSRVSARFIIVVDVFQTIEVVEALFQPIFQQYTAAKVLIIGRPSRVPATSVLNNALLSTWMGDLLVHLIQQKQWSILPKHGVGAAPQFLVGVGSGASTATYFSTVIAPQHPKLSVLMQAYHGVILMNGFACSEGIKTKIQQLMHGLQQTNEMECHQQLASMLFCDSYLHESTRETALATFFQYRRGFLESEARQLFLFQLKGVLKHQDVRPVLSNLQLPLFLVQSSHNSWIPPAHVVYFQEKRGVVTTLDAAFVSRRESMVHVSWIKAGHELLQERPTFLPKYMDQIISAAQFAIETYKEDIDEILTDDTLPQSSEMKRMNRQGSFGVGSDEPLILGQATTGGTPETEEAPLLHPRVQNIYEEKGIKGIREELIERDIDPPLSHDQEILWLLHRTLLAEETAQQALEAKRLERKQLELEHESAVERQEQERLQKKQRELARQQARFQKEALALKTKEEIRTQLQKLADDEWRERSNLESEDQQSRRREIHDAKMVQWREINEHALETVDAINEERKEMQEEQEAIQQGLDRAAHRASLQNDLWTLQRKLEEGQVKLRGDTEGYGLESVIASENIPTLVKGINCLIHDINAIRAQKHHSLLLQAESQQKQQQIQSKLNDINRMYQNLLRVLHRAEEEKVIAKPEAGGAVRLLPATPQAMRHLREKINSLHQEIAHMTSIVAVANEEVLMYDRVMQSIAVLQKRTDNALLILQEKAKGMTSEANIDLSVIREDQEAEAIADSKRLNSLHVAEARITRVADELERITALSTPFIDTQVYIAGTLQRVEKKILYEKLQEELLKLQKEVEQLQSDGIVGKERRSTLRNQGMTLTESLVSLLQAESELQELAVLLRQTTVHEVQLTAKVANAEPNKRSTAVDYIRRLPVKERSNDEKKWVALDRLLSPQTYLSMHEVDLQEMRLDPLYSTSLSAQQAHRILQLPERISLALPFLKSPEEVDAHRLLRQYTAGDGEEVFNALDEKFAPPLVIHDLDTAMRKQLGSTVRLKPLASCTPEELEWRQCDAALREPLQSLIIPQGLSLAELQEMAKLPQSTHPIWRLLYRYGSLAPPSSVIVQSLSQVVSSPDHCVLLVDTHQTAKLLDLSQCRLRARQSATHEIIVEANAIHLTISIVFEGKFTSVGYQVGRLAAMLYYMSDSAPVPLGQVSYTDISLNTRDALGRIRIRHLPKQIPIAQGRYHLVIGCPSETIYSVVVNCHCVSSIGDYIKQSKQLALTQQARLPVGRQEIDMYWQTMRLAERKLQLVKQASSEAMQEAKAQEAKMHALQSSLDHASDKVATDNFNRTHVLQQIREAERSFTKQCKLHTIRLEEIRDIQQGLQHLASLHAELLLERARLEMSLREYRQYLPDATGRIEGHTAGFKIGYAIGADYHVVKTAKMRWRDIAALKGQLRTLLTSAQRVRRKYKKNRLGLSSIERQWILLDRIRFPDFYLWEQEAVHATNFLHESNLAPPGMELTVHEKALIAWKATELERLLASPVNQLRSKELQVRKTMLAFRDTKVTSVPTALLATWRTTPPEELKPEQREWIAVERILHPELYSNKLQSQLPTHWTREKLQTLIQMPEEQIAVLGVKDRHMRDLIWHYDNEFCQSLITPKKPVESHRPIAHDQQGLRVEVDVDMRCRLVLKELDRAMTNPNDMMDSSMLHSAPQRFPTKVLRLELEKELDRLLLGQLYEREQAEWKVYAANDKPDAEDSSDSDFEAQIARESKAKQLKGTEKKAKPSFQKQKRAIQDALIPKTIEQEQLELLRKQLGPGGCMACQENPCKWTPYLGDRLPTIEHRVHILQDETERVKRSKEGILSSAICLTAVRGGIGAVSLRKMDLFLELTSECRIWEKHIRLRELDSELHATYNWTESHFETIALHGFKQMQQTEKVQAALTREQNTLVAQLVTFEIIEDILEYMLEGWHFGERESLRKVQGYVPSIYKDGPLTVHALRSVSALQQDPLGKEAEELKSIEEAKAKYGIPIEKWTPIEIDAQNERRHLKAVKEGSTVSTLLNETEQALKFGLFCMTLMYFRGLNLLKKQKQTWNIKTNKEKQTTNGPTPLQQERKKQQARQRQLDTANAKAKAGLDRKYQKEQERLQSYRHKLYAQHRLAKAESKAATHIQRVFRGFLGRGASAKWKIRRAELEAMSALEEAAATTMQRAYRGRLGRLAAEARRIELAEFIAQIRAEEAIVEEEEYWKRHFSERLRRRINGFLERKAA